MSPPPRAEEHPDPQRRRESYISLHGGRWHFSFDDAEVGMMEGWFKDVSRFKDARDIVVPFAFQWEMSGINEQAKHEVVWYGRDFEVPGIREDERILLHFGAVDYAATVFINGQQVTHHEGGHVPFQVDITHALSLAAHQTARKALLVVRVEDRYIETQPRGKQHANNVPEGIMYTCTTGIWQPVWLEVVNKMHFDTTTLAIVSDLDDGNMLVAFDLNLPACADQLEVDICVSTESQVVASSNAKADGSARMLISVPVLPKLADDRTSWTDYFWTPEKPCLFNLRMRLVSLSTGKVYDEVFSYMGMRKISINEDGRICLNNKPYYQRLVLDQGYWPKSGLTAPSDEDFVRDIKLAKSFGFNGARKHMKPEDPRWLYHCDRLGFLVWAEPAAAFQFSTAATRRLIREFADQIERDWSHPCIVTYCCINENWGVPQLMGYAITGFQQRAYLEQIRTMCKTLDPTRLVSVNDGWNNLTTTEIVGLHDYTLPDQAETYWKAIESHIKVKGWGIGGTEAFATEHHYAGQPILCTELGGYFGTSESMLKQMNQMANNMRHAQGFVYTQLTDVMQERNGLCDESRKAKLDPAAVKAVFDAIDYKPPH